MELRNDSALGEGRKRGLSFHHLADAPDVFDAGVFSPQQMSEDSAAASARLKEFGWPMTASVAKVLVSQTENEGGFQLHYLWLKPHFTHRRHHHPVDCLYYVISGSARMGKRDFRAGDSFFVPSGVQYQYSAGSEGVEVLEFRHGPRVVDTIVAEQSPEQWQRLIDVAAAHQAEWQEMDVSPTFAQNRESVASR